MHSSCQQHTRGRPPAFRIVLGARSGLRWRIFASRWRDAEPVPLRSSTGSRRTEDPDAGSHTRTSTLSRFLKVCCSKRHLVRGLATQLVHLLYGWIRLASTLCWDYLQEHG